MHKARPALQGNVELAPVNGPFLQSQLKDCRCCILTAEPSYVPRVVYSPGVGVVSLGPVGVYIALFMPTYAIVNLGMPKTAAFVSTLIFGVVMSIGSPFVGMLADKAGPPA